MSCTLKPQTQTKSKIDRPNRIIKKIATETPGPQNSKKPTKKKNGCGCGCGCLVIIIILAFLIIWAYQF